MDIAKVAGSVSHVEYVCQVLRPGEAESAPRSADYGLGTFVAIARRDGGHLVGVIANTMLQNPEFGVLGPRLSPETDLAVFSPDYIAEKRTVVSVVVIGEMDADGASRQEIPAVAAEIDAPVRRLTDEEIASFHGGARGFQAAYLPLLLSMSASPLMPSLVLRLASALQALFPDAAAQLAILRANIAWRARIEPLG
jgi:phage tail protein X